MTQRPPIAESEQLRQPPTPGVQGARELNQRGIARFQVGDIAGALADFRRATALDPDYPEPWNNAGLARQRLGQHREAIADFDRALALRPGYAEALSNRGRTRQALADGPGARADYDRALGHASGGLVGVVLHNRGLLSHGEGDLVAALADFDRALAIAPGRTATLAARGTARKEAGDLDGAQADFERALALEPPAERAALYHGRGGVRVLRNDFAGALADYERALALEPHQCYLYVSRGNARYHRRDPRAVADFRTAFRLDAEGAARDLARTLVADARRDAPAVLENSGKHLRLNEHDAIARARRGLTLLLLGRDAEAAPDLACAQTLHPEMRPHLHRLIELMMECRGHNARFGQVE